jgi:hypothetical protein
VESSDDGREWQKLREVEGNRRRDHLYLPETEARLLRVTTVEIAGGAGYGIASLDVKPLEWAKSLESFFEAVARDALRGDYPRAIVGEQSYWTVVGRDGDREEGLVSEDGVVEAGKQGFSIEPFLYADGRLITWADVRISRGLEGTSVLPAPWVRWETDSLELNVSVNGVGVADTSALLCDYRVRNTSRRARSVTLYLAIRPFQVNPPAQFLNTPGGVSRIRDLSREGDRVRVNGGRGVVSIDPPAGFGALSFDHGNIVDFMRRGALPGVSRIADTFGFASGALDYGLDLPAAGEGKVRVLATIGSAPLESMARLPLPAERPSLRIPPVSIHLLPDAVTQTLYAQLGFIRVNRDGPAIQPGSRAYDRSWIRDGALTSSAMLRMGLADDVRAYVEWFAGHQYENGKVPCCVDRRGPDPVPEHDSHGEFIFIVAEYVRTTGDSAFAGRMWPHVRAAAAYMDSLRQQRRTDEYRTPERREFFGLLPPSISHEGYSAKPMHSYWDDFFALRGFADAAYLAGALRYSEEAARWGRVHAEFASDFRASIVAAMAKHQVDYVPGCADLGDFDATSTTIALSPVQAGAVVPGDALRRTFERYWTFFTERRDGKTPWEAFTPYEIRNIGAFVRLGWRERANELLDYFLSYRRPAGWPQWAEVVWRDERTPHFIGDMPHTWVGSDYVRSVLDMLAYERESDDALVIGAGVPAAWVREAPGVSVAGLRTWHGALDFEMQGKGAGIEVRIGGGLRVPRGGIVIAAPGVRPGWKARVNGAKAQVSLSGEVIVRAVPATVVLEP